MREDKDAICICSHLKGDHEFHVGPCHKCSKTFCKKFKWNNLDYLQAMYELKEEKKRRNDSSK